MSQSNIFVDIGNSAVKWRTHKTEVFFQNIDTFSLKSLPKADTVWVSAVAHTNILEAIMPLNPPPSIDKPNIILELLIGLY